MTVSCACTAAACLIAQSSARSELGEPSTPTTTPGIACPFPSGPRSGGGHEFPCIHDRAAERVAAGVGYSGEGPTVPRGDVSPQGPTLWEPQSAVSFTYPPSVRAARLAMVVFSLSANHRAADGGEVSGALVAALIRP